jgi:hypothetical protein
MLKQDFKEFYMWNKNTYKIYLGLHEKNQSQITSNTKIKCVV